MILWNRERPYNTKLTVNEREEIAKAISTPDTIKFANRLNTVINGLALTAALCAFQFTNYNLVVFILAFIVTDAILLVVDHLVFIAIPHWKTMHLSLDDAQTRLDKVKQKRSFISNEIAKYKREHCKNCYRSCSSCYQTLVEQKVVLDGYIADEERWINQELNKIKEREIEMNKKRSGDYDNKKDYLIAMRDKMEYYVAKHNISNLAPIVCSLNLLIDTLAVKPFGYELVSNGLYIYLDELQGVVDKLVELDDEKQTTYMGDISKIAVALSNSINATIEKIDKPKINDIEVGIVVLLKELTNEEREEKNV